MRTRDGWIAQDEYFQAEQNARLDLTAERYYRAMFRGRHSSWNLRDTHIADTLDALLGRLDAPERGLAGSLEDVLHRTALPRIFLRFDDPRLRGFQQPAAHVEPPDWSRFFDAFSRQHEGWIVSVQETAGGPAPGRDVEVSGLPLEGLSTDPDRRSIFVMVAAGPTGI